MLDGFVAQGLRQVRFTNAGWSDKQNVFSLAQVIARRQFENLFAVDGWIELPVKVFQSFESTKVGGFGATG